MYMYTHTFVNKFLGNTPLAKLFRPAVFTLPLKVVNWPLISMISVGTLSILSAPVKERARPAWKVPTHIPGIMGKI